MNPGKTNGVIKYFSVLAQAEEVALLKGKKVLSRKLGITDSNLQPPTLKSVFVCLFVFR